MKAVLLFSDKVMTRFMQDADMFESFKAVVKPLVIATVVKNWGKKHIERILKCPGNHELIAAVSDKITWFNPDIKAISTGTQWTPLEDYIPYMKSVLRDNK